MWAQLVTIATILVPGILLGFFAAKMTKKGSVGTFFNMIIGVAGAAAGYYAIPYVGFLVLGAFIGSIINASIGAVLLLIILKLMKK